MTMREVDRFNVVQAMTEARLKPSQAAERLGLSVRQVERLVIRYRDHKGGGVASGRRDLRHLLAGPNRAELMPVKKFQRLMR